jgi:hypothetical protein
MKSSAKKKRKYRKLQIKPDAYRVGETVTKERAEKLGGIVERPLAYANSGGIVLRRQEAKIECTLDGYKYRSMISDQQHQAGIMFRAAYHSAARGMQVADPTLGPIDGCDSTKGHEKATQARMRLKEADDVLTFQQYSVVEAVAGWDTLAGNSRRLDNLRAGLDELYRMWF